MGRNAADIRQLQEVPGATEAVLPQTRIQRQHGQIDLPAPERFRHTAWKSASMFRVPDGVLALPVPPVQIPGMKDRPAFRRHQKGHALVRGGQCLHGARRAGRASRRPPRQDHSTRQSAAAPAETSPALPVSGRTAGRPCPSRNRTSRRPSSRCKNCGTESGPRWRWLAKTSRGRPDGKGGQLPLATSQTAALLTGQLQQEAAVAQEADAHH